MCEKNWQAETQVNGANKLAEGFIYALQKTPWDVEKIPQKTLSEIAQLLWQMRI